MQTTPRLEYRNIRDTGKTFTWEVYSDEIYLGVISWYSPWRRYCFYPSQNTIFDRGCLQEICGMIDEQMKLRKELA